MGHSNALVTSIEVTNAFECIVPFHNKISGIYFRMNGPEFYLDIY